MGGPAKNITGDAAELRKAYWRANLRLIGVLLTIWAVVSYVCGILLVEQLNAVPVPLFKIPLGFWFAQQGAICVFVLLIFVYAWRMQKLDQKFGVEERPPTSQRRQG